MSALLPFPHLLSCLLRITIIANIYYLGSVFCKLFFNRHSLTKQNPAWWETSVFYLWLIHTAVWQKPIQYCIVIILQLKKKGNIGVLLLMRKGKEHAISSQLLSGETRIWSLHCLTSTSIFFYSCCLVTKSYLTLCNLMDYSKSGSSVLHYLLELAQIQVH